MKITHRKQHIQSLRIAQRKQHIQSMRISHRKQHIQSMRTTQKASTDQHSHIPILLQQHNHRGRGCERMLLKLIKRMQAGTVGQSLPLNTTETIPFTKKYEQSTRKINVTPHPRTKRKCLLMLRSFVCQCFAHLFYQ